MEEKKKRNSVVDSSLYFFSFDPLVMSGNSTHFHLKLMEY